MNPPSDITSNEQVENEDVRRILNLINQGQKKISFSGHDNVAVLLGNTGSGKSTLAQFIGGSNNELYSDEVIPGSGEFLIRDKDDKISIYSTVSKTTFPELVIDDAKNAYIDCPGFNDSRNEAYDVAISYFITKSLKSVKGVKFVLVVSYSSLRKGVSRDDFTQLLKHVTNILKNPHKYGNGIALIATKVDYTYIFDQGIPILVEDDVVIENIIIFLKEVRERFQQQLNDHFIGLNAIREEDVDYIRSSLILLDSFVTKKDGQYKRIGIVRRPNQAGMLSQISFLKQNKAYIKSILQSNIEYVKIDDGDIGFTVSDKSANIIRDLADQLDKDISAQVSITAADLIKYYKSEEEKHLTNDLHSLNDKLGLGLQSLSALKAIDQSSNAEQLVAEMFAQFEKAQVRIPASPLREILKLANILKFLENVCSKKFDLQCSKWVESLLDAYSYMENSKLWYTLMENVYERLGEYEIQKKFDNRTIPAFQKEIVGRNGTESLENIRSLMQFIDHLKGDDDWLMSFVYQQLKKIQLNQVKLQYLDMIIRSTLKEKTTIKEYKEPEMLPRVEIVGEFVRLSRVKNRDWEKTSLQIYARNTVFIDADLNNMCDVSIVARQWQNVGNRQITLKKPKMYYNLNNCSTHYDPKNFGHFFGVGQLFKNIGNLKINNWSCKSVDKYGAVQFINLSENNEMPTVMNMFNEDAARIETREEPKSIDPYPRSKVISQYRKYISNTVNDFIRKSITLKFYPLLWLHLSLRYMDDEEKLLNEIQEIEKNYHNSDSKTKRFFYDLFSERFEKIMLFRFHDYSPIKAEIKRKLIKFDLVSENWLIMSETFFYRLFELFIPFDWEKINSFYNDVAYNYIDQVEKFLYSNLVILIQELSFSTDKQIIQLAHSSDTLAQEMVNAVLRRSALMMFSKIGGLLRLICNWVKLEFDIIKNVNISDDVSILCNAKVAINQRPSEKIDLEIKLSNQLTEWELKSFNNADVGCILNELAVARRLLISRGFCYEQCESLHRKEIELQIIRHNNISLISKKQASKIYDEIYDILRPLLKDEINKDLLKIFNRAKLRLEFAAYEMVMFEEVQNMDERLIAAVLDQLPSKNKILSSFDDDISKIFELLSKEIKFNPLKKITFHPMKEITFNPMKEITSEPLKETYLIKIMRLTEEITSTFSCNMELDENSRCLVQNICQGANMLINALKILPSYKNRKLLIANLHYANTHSVSTLSVKKEIALFEYETMLQSLKYYVEFIRTVNGFNFAPRGDDNLKSLAHIIKNLRNDLVKKLPPNSFSAENVGRHASKRTIFKWKYSSHSDAILRLLSGQEISLISVIPKNSSYEMVKFGALEVAFKLRKDQEHRELSFQKMLQNFKIQMTHSGSSYYSLSGRVFRLDTLPFSFLYDFKTNSFSKIESKYDVSPYERSPYTTWKFRLQPDNRESLKLLQQFRKSKFDVVLQGFVECIPAEKEMIGGNTILHSYGDLFNYNEEKSETLGHLSAVSDLDMDRTRTDGGFNVTVG